MLAPVLLDQLQADLTAAMKARDEVVVGTLRMAIAAVKEAAVAGDAARQLSDDEVLAVLARQAKQRDEAVEAFTAGGRPEQAAREAAEREVLARYLPKGLSEAELEQLVRTTLAEGGFEGPKAMGPAMKAVQAAVAGRADGKAVAALVKQLLGS